MPSSGNPTWQDSPSTTTPINAAHLNALEAAVAGSAPVSSAWTANTPVKAGQLLVNAGTIYQVNADMTTPASFATTGLTVVGTGGSSAVLVPTAVKTAAYTAAAWDYVPVDTTSGAVTITLPTAPADKVQIGVKHVIQGGTNTVTIAAGGSDVFNKTGGATTTTLTLVDQNKVLQYKASGAIWYIVDDSLTLATLDARYPLASSIAPLAQSGQTPSQAPVPNGSASVVGTQAFSARSDHSHQAQPMPYRPFLVNEWRLNYPQSGSYLAPTTGTLVLSLIHVPCDFTLDGLACVAGNATAGTIRLCMYSDNNGTPGTGLVDTGTKSLTTGTAAISWNALALSGQKRGYYWVGYLAESVTGTPQLGYAQAMASAWSIMPAGTGTTPSISYGNDGYVATEASVSGTQLSRTFGGSLANNHNAPLQIPCIWLRFSAVTF